MSDQDMNSQTTPSRDRSGERFRHPVVLGAGPVGRAIAAVLIGRGHRPTVVTRSGAEIAGAVSRRADLSDPTAAVDALADATIVFSTAQPEYHRWAEEFPALQHSIIEACASAGSPLMVVENLYGYGEQSAPLHESMPMNPATKKGRVRAAMWRDLEVAHDSGQIQMAVVRASDFIGPGVDGSAFGSRFFEPVRAGKPAQTMGDVDARHAVTFVPDLAEAMVRVAEDDTSWGRAWHAPSDSAVTQRQLAALAAAKVGVEAKIRSTPVFVLRIVGLFIKPAGEMVEMVHEFDRDFLVDSSAFTERFAMTATPLNEAVAAVMGTTDATAAVSS